MTHTFENSRWLVNGKRCEDWNLDEKHFFDNLIQEVKINAELYSEKRKENPVKFHKPWELLTIPN